MKKLLIFTAIFLIGVVGNTQTTELDTIFERQGNQITVSGVIKKTEVIGQFTLPDSVEFTQQEYKQLFLGEAVDKLMESHSVLIQLFPPQKAKVGIFVTFYHFRDGIQKGEIKTQIIDKPEFSLAFLLVMVLSLIGIVWVSVLNICHTRYKLVALYGISMVIFIAGIIFLHRSILQNELYESYRVVYEQLIWLYAGCCVFGFIVHEVFIWLKKLRKHQPLSL